MAENIIAGLDIGSSHIRIVVGQTSRAGETEQLNVIGVVEVPAQGLNKGAVVSIEDVVSSISACLEKAERMIGLPIENAWVGIGGTHISSQESNGVIAIARTSGEIQENDVERVIEAARAVAAPVNYEILHVVPKNFSIDNQTGVKDPIGMSGIRLEVTTQVIRALNSQVKNLTKCIYRIGLDINDLVLSVLAAAEAVLSPRQKELGVALVDIGASTTKVIVFEEGDVLHVSVLPIGADHITADLAIGLQTSLDVAERIKIEIGTALPKNFEKEDEINLRDHGGEDQVFSKKYIAEIVEARVEEVFEKVDQELQKINRSGLLPAGIILIGGGSKLPGLIEVGKRKTMLPVSLGASKKFNTAVDKVNDLSFVTGLGLVMWGYNVMNEKGMARFGLSNQFKSVKEAADKMKKWVKNLIS
ncbi:cell division protein FtsA [Candidatus Falkowbacteria bacterium]|jgi:cell division protein FtsA|nr:cell division protein FtsA [Candidatus Falkowbacteria bacterium]MBT5503634.1 cell division protein FtsA [Candidatus Falkowbacteria bacterium]MBT6574098.1 cell division protein FtsA [Candidatus Falkowbacteria bacterium]MBT7500696.1 cell division protein FtsA [Candidatus Falkowbacteria bacterium]